MRNSAISVLEYLVLKMLAGKEDVVRALHDYFVEGASPSTIASRYNLSKHQIRGYVQRIMEKTGSPIRARVFMKYAVPVIIKIKPVVTVVNGSMALCNICKDELPLQIVEDHIKKRHSEVVTEYLYSVVEILKKNSKNEGNTIKRGV